MNLQQPHNIEMEQWLLACLLLDNDLINKIETKENDFYSMINKLIFSSIKKLINNNSNIDLIILKDYLEQNKFLDYIWWISYLTNLFDNIFLYSYKEYDDKIREYSKRRQIINKWKEISYLWEKENIDWIYKQIEDLNLITVDRKDTSNIDYSIEKFNNFLEKCKKLKSLWFPSAYKSIDKYTWWIIEWKVYTIVAYSNVWKSNFAYSLIPTMLKQWKKVIFFSLEVQQDILFMNIAKAYYNLTLHDFFKGFQINKEDFKNLYIYDNIYDLEKVEAISKTKKPDIIFIDYIQNLQTVWNSEYEKMSKIAVWLQRLAIQTNITVFSISQANNESRFKNTAWIQPKWSWAIFSSSDVILWLWNSDWDLKLSIIKNKYWPNNKHFLVIPDFKKCQFKIVQEEEDTFENDFIFKL